MEALILAMIIAYAVKKAAEDAHLHWQGAKSANRKASKGKPVSKRAASAIQHDAGYWAHQTLNGFPQVRNGLAAGWHAGRTAQQQGRAQRQKARTGHLEERARLMPELREHRRRQAGALEEIRAARQPEPEPATAEPEGRHCAMCPRVLPDGYDGAVCPECRSRIHEHALSTRRPRQEDDSDTTPPATPTEGNAMTASDDITYASQLRELTEIRRDAEEEVNSTRRKRMMNRLDVLMSLGLDRQTCAEAAAIDDALQAQEKAAQQTLDAADAAASGLRQRHGGIQEAVSDSPVDQPAQPEFYQE